MRIPAFVFILCLFVAGFSIVAQAQRPVPEAKLIVAYFYADWCGNCKILSPALEEARKEGDLDRKDILFVKFDLTDKASIHQTMMMAKLTGLDAYLRAQGSATGYAAVLEVGSMQEIVRFDRDSKANDITTALSSALVEWEQ